jgi:hypothetical protein
MVYGEGSGRDGKICKEDGKRSCDMTNTLESIFKWIFIIIGGISALIGIKKYLDEHPLTIPKVRFYFLHLRKTKAIKRYLKNELDRLFSKRAPGSYLFIKDIIQMGGIFTNPLWIKYQERGLQPVPTKDNRPVPLEEYIIDTIAKNGRLLLLGAPGQGKSTVMQRVFSLMAERFITNQSDLIPIYISCRQLVLLNDDAICLEDIAHALEKDNNPIPLTTRDIRKTFKNRVVLIFDGLDEIGGTIKQAIIHQRTDSEIFLLPGITSCRTNFYQTYLTGMENKLTRNIEKVELCLLDTPSVRNYINANCQISGKKEVVDTIVQTIEQNKDLNDLSKRFLSLVMMVDLFSDGFTKPNQFWNITTLYEEYSRKWLTQEALKHPGLDWNHKSEIMEKVAWEIHTKLTSNVPYGENNYLTISSLELENLLAKYSTKHNLSVPELTNDVLYRTFLINDGDNFVFIHRSFQEFYVAKFIYRNMSLNISDAKRVLQEFFPVEIASFLKDMLHSSHDNFKERISDNLMQVYRELQNDDIPSSLTARDHACYYLGRTKSDRIEKFLEEYIPSEKREWIRRGMVIDLIYTYKKRSVLRNYLKELKQNPHKDAVNLGYHLEYYGDQAPEGDHIDKNGINCDRTINSLMRHLKNPLKYEVGWALDLYTLKRVLETRNKSGSVKNLIPDDELIFLKEFLNKSYATDDDLEREKRQLCRVMQKAGII